MKGDKTSSSQSIEDSFHPNWPEDCALAFLQLVESSIYTMLNVPLSFSDPHFTIANHNRRKYTVLLTCYVRRTSGSIIRLSRLKRRKRSINVKCLLSWPGFGFLLNPVTQCSKDLERLRLISNYGSRSILTRSGPSPECFILSERTRNESRMEAVATKVSHQVRVQYSWSPLSAATSFSERIRKAVWWLWQWNNGKRGETTVSISRPLTLRLSV